MNRSFGPQSYSLEDVFAEERHPRRQLTLYGDRAAPGWTRYPRCIGGGTTGCSGPSTGMAGPCPGVAGRRRKLPSVSARLEVLEKAQSGRPASQTLGPWGAGGGCCPERSWEGHCPWRLAASKPRLSLAVALDRRCWGSGWSGDRSGNCCTIPTPVPWRLEGPDQRHWMGWAGLIKLGCWTELGLGLCLDRPQESLLPIPAPSGDSTSSKQALQIAARPLSPATQHLWIIPGSPAGSGQYLWIDVAGAQTVLAQLQGTDGSPAR
jgi:hypothetical protein